MKYLIFSDTHLTHIFDEKKFLALKEAIDSADRVIINGDFWEGFGSSFEKFITSEWVKTLFPLLKKKKAVYIFGNHDKEMYSDKRVSLFSDEQMKSFILKSGKNIFHITHGDLEFPLPDLPAWACTILEFFEDIAVKFFGKAFLWLAYGWMNREIKKRIQGRYKANEFLVIGHTHYAEIDLENHFINDGFNKHHLAQYIFIEDGRVTAISKKY